MAIFTEAELTKGVGGGDYTILKSRSAQALYEEHQRTDSTKHFDIFLSHSSLDAFLINQLRNKIRELGFSVYVDWIVDPELDRSKVTANTAKFLRGRMRQCSSLLFAISVNAATSKWMPWELGYFDGFDGKVAILPIAKTLGTNVYAGQEYLGIYPYVTHDVNREGKQTLWVHEALNKYVRFDLWLQGKKPQIHPSNT